MAYKSYKERKEALISLRSGKVNFIPCPNCNDGKVFSDPNIPIEQQVVFYCDTCKSKIIIN